MAGQTLVTRGSPCPPHSEPWAQVLAAPTPASSKGLCSVKRWMGHGSEEAKSPKIALIQKVSIIQRERGELLLTEDAKSTNCLLVKKGFVSIEHDR